MSAEAVFEVEHVGNVAPEYHVHHLESLLPVALAAAVRAVDICVQLDQLTREVVAGRTGIHEAEVHADDLAGRPAILVNERRDRRVDRLPRVVNLIATHKLLTKQPLLPAQRLAGRHGLLRGVRQGYLFSDTCSHHALRNATNASSPRSPVTRADESSCYGEGVDESR